MLHDGLASRIEKILVLEQLIFGIHELDVELPFSSTGQSTGDEKRGIINYWTYHVDMIHPKTNCHKVSTKTIFSTKKQQKVCWQLQKSKGVFID